jgi:hypothetical protein
MKQSPCPSRWRPSLHRDGGRWRTDLLAASDLPQVSVADERTSGRGDQPDWTKHPSMGTKCPRAAERAVAKGGPADDGRALARCGLDRPRWRDPGTPRAWCSPAARQPLLEKSHSTAAPERIFRVHSKCRGTYCSADMRWARDRLHITAPRNAEERGRFSNLTPSEAAGCAPAVHEAPGHYEEAGSGASSTGSA